MLISASTPAKAVSWLKARHGNLPGSASRYERDAAAHVGPTDQATLHGARKPRSAASHWLKPWECS